jgi:hypothetical protein
MPRGKAGERKGKRGRPFSAATLRRSLEEASVADIQAELTRRQSIVTELEARREALASELASVDQAIAHAGGVAKSRGRGRPRGSAARVARLGAPASAAAGRKRRRRGRGGNESSLVSTLQQVLSGTTLSVVDAVEAVKRAGYRTKAAHFRTIVNQALTANPDVFRKVSRGMYTSR